MFGEKVTNYDKFSEDTYGYIIRVKAAPSLYAVKTLQLSTAAGLSDVVSSPVDLATLLGYPSDSECPDLAYAFESGLVYIFIQLTDYPYVDATEMLMTGYRYPEQLMTLDDNLDIPYGDLELFTALATAMGAELQGKQVPQRILDKINYLKSMLE